MFDVNDPSTNPGEQVESTHPQADEQQQEMRSVYEAFDLHYPTDEDDHNDPEDELDDRTAAPPIDGEPVDPEQRKGITVKYNGQDVFIPETEVEAHARKGLNYDKIEGRAKQYETALDRLARQQGYKDHADLIANLDKIEQEAVQQQQNQFDQLKAHLRQEAEDAGIDPDSMERYLDNHPLIKQAKDVIQRSEQEQQLKQQEQSQQQLLQGWEDLFRKYPHLADQVNPDGGSAPWLTPEMHSRLERGYDPIDAYELVHRDSIMADERKRTEQSVLKNQRLNKRAQVVGQGNGERQPEVPAELSSAFAAFGIDPKNAQKYAKNFENK
ncbi:hypothetical protein AWU65_20390 [Paenibacillus glucanolyticus]|uniref:Uncharacterized protein n=1 Tax=Paenibacillus glucanolyticus TaxID=59843 RepID=A0A163LGM7_9BACL|nr:hypothetical protein [Paenibacillus glucanolyticus]KZS48117.1 hypothetical protein AWU65_20390 [Paenibacillus glucanolyticus]